MLYNIYMRQRRRKTNKRRYKRGGKKTNKNNKRRRKSGGRRRKISGGEPISKMVLSTIVRWSRLRRRKFRKHKQRTKRR